MLDVFEKVSNIISEFEIGVLLIGKDRRISWANDYILKKYKSEGGIIGEDCGIILRFAKECEKILDSSFVSSEIDRIVTPWKSKDNQIEYCRNIFIPIRDGSKSVEQVLWLVINLTKREKSAFEVIELNKFLSNVVHNSADAIISLDRDGKIKSWNKGAETIFEYKSGEVIGKKLDFLFPKKLIKEGELEWIEKVVLEKDAIVNYETERVTKSGRVIIAGITRTLLKNERNEIIGSSIIIKDITDRKKIEEELKNTIEELSKLNQIAELIHGTHDINEILNLMLTGVTAGEGFRFNRAFLFLYNEDKKLLEGRNAIGPSNPEEAGKIWSSLIISKSLKDILNLYKDNVDKTDIETKRLVQNIKIDISSSDNVLIKSFNSGQHYIIEKEKTFDTETLNLLKRFNTDHFIVIPLIGRKSSIGVLVVDNAISKKRIHEEEIGLLRLFAHQSSLAIENAKLYNSLEEKLNLLGKAYYDLESSQKKLMQMERLAAVGEVTAKVAHEIRNPLVSLGGFARILKRELANSDFNLDYINVIIDEVNRLENILTDIVNFAKPKDISDKKNNNLNNTIEKTIKIMDEEFNSNDIILEKYLAAKLPELYYDDWEISQVFLNLFRNAIQAMPSGGKLTVRSYLSDGLVKVDIEDTGNGIPGNMIQEIFNPFFTTKSKGMGLGLSICKQILSNHNCGVNIKSELEIGTTFILNFSSNKK